MKTELLQIISSVIVVGGLRIDNVSVETQYMIQSNALYHPEASLIACETLYILDTGNNRILTVNRTTGGAKLYVGVFPGFADGVGSDARFNNPRGFTLLPDFSTMYVADTNNDAVREIAFAAANVSTLSTSLPRPTNIVADNSFIYVSSEASVWVMDSVSGAFVWQSNDNDFEGPCGMALNSSVLFVSDALLHQIFLISLSNFNVSPYAGSGIAGYADGHRLTAEFYGPTGLVFMWQHLFISDTANHLLRVINTITDEVFTLAGVPASSGYIDGSGASALFSSPMGLYASVNIIGEPLIFIADRENNRVRTATLHGNSVPIPSDPLVCSNEAKVPTTQPTHSPTAFPQPTRSPTAPSSMIDSPTSIPSLTINPTAANIPTSPPTASTSSPITSTEHPTLIPTSASSVPPSSIAPQTSSPTLLVMPSIVPLPLPTAPPSNLENITKQSRDGKNITGISTILWIVVAIAIFLVLLCVVYCCVFNGWRILYEKVSNMLHVEPLEEHAATTSTINPQRMLMIFR